MPAPPPSPLPDHPCGWLHHPGPLRHGRGAREVPRGGRADAKQRPAVEQHWNVLLWQAALCGGECSRCLDLKLLPGRSLTLSAVCVRVHVNRPLLA